MFSRGIYPGEIGRRSGGNPGACIEGIVGVRDCPYGICWPWVRGGWDLDALGKFFRRLCRRCRRRRPRLRAGGSNPLEKHTSDGSK